MYMTQPTTWFRPESIFLNGNGEFFSALHREIDQVFDNFGHCSSARATGRSMPRMNVTETDSAIEIEAELPGVEEKDLDITLNEDVLTIKGEKRVLRDEQQKDYYHQEILSGRFARSVTLPFEPDPKTVKTLFAKGVLKITLPKTANLKQQTIKIPVRLAA